MTERTIGHAEVLATNLTAPVKDVVHSAMEQLALHGKVETVPGIPGAKQTKKKKRIVYLCSGASLLSLTDMAVESRDGEVVSVGDTVDGLIIEEVRVGAHYEPESFGVSFQAPRDTQSVGARSVSHLISIAPEEMRTIADRIRNGHVVRPAVYKTAAAKMTAKARAK